MCRTIKLVVLALVFLSACGEVSVKEKGNKSNDGDDGNKVLNQATQQSSTDILKEGSELFSKYGCFACHSIDGSVMYGPPLNDLYKKEVSVLRRGKEKTIVADRKYFTKAIMDPDYEKVSDYEIKIMPKPDIPKEDVEILIDYLIEVGKEK